MAITLRMISPAIKIHLINHLWIRTNYTFYDNEFDKPRSFKQSQI